MFFLRLFLIFINLISVVSAQKYVDRNIFEVCYSEKKQQPIWLKYVVQCDSSHYSRKSMYFKKDTSSIITSDANDYYNNIWDKGHLAPAAHFACDYTDLSSTFNYLNCALQHKDLNRGPWKSLEIFERKISKNYHVECRVELKFDNNSLQLETGAFVPSYFLKILSYNNIQKAFLFPNNSSVKGKNWSIYEVKDYIINEACEELSY